MSLSLCKIMQTLLQYSDWSSLSVVYSPATATAADNLCSPLVNIINTYSRAYIFSDKTHKMYLMLLACPVFFL